MRALKWIQFSTSGIKARNGLPSGVIVTNASHRSFAVAEHALP